MSKEAGPSSKFDPNRLVDRDGDGWWEYIAAGANASDGGPPYVYFDGTTYTAGAWPIYPNFNSAVKDQLTYAGNVGTWHYCVPFGTTTNGANVTWINTQKFQILPAGLPICIRRRRIH